MSSRAKSNQPKALTLPFQRDPKFIGREDTIEILKERHEQAEQHHRTALVGLAGVG